MPPLPRRPRATLCCRTREVFSPSPLTCLPVPSLATRVSSGPDEYFQAGRGPGAQYLPYLEHQEENASSTQGSERSNASGTVITGARRVRQRVVPHRVHFVTLSHLFSFPTIPPNLPFTPRHVPFPLCLCSSSVFLPDVLSHAHHPQLPSPCTCTLHTPSTPYEPRLGPRPLFSRFLISCVFPVGTMCFPRRRRWSPDGYLDARDGARGPLFPPVTPSRQPSDTPAAVRGAFAPTYQVDSNQEGLDIQSDSRRRV